MPASLPVLGGEGRRARTKNPTSRNILHFAGLARPISLYIANYLNVSFMNCNIPNET